MHWLTRQVAAWPELSQVEARRQELFLDFPGGCRAQGFGPSFGVFLSYKQKAGSQEALPETEGAPTWEAGSTGRGLI